MFTEETYRSWKEFEMEERRRVATFQLSVDNLARDLYLEPDLPQNDDEDDEIVELNFEY